VAETTTGLPDLAAARAAPGVGGTGHSDRREVARARRRPCSSALSLPRSDRAA
jgi:hypothetical protein